MVCEAPLLLERFITLVALEWFLTGVLPHVSLQSIRSSASIVALVTLQRPFSGVLPHHVNFQCTSLTARILACCASVWLFSRVRHLVRLQVACFCCLIFTLIALVQFFPSVFLDMPFDVGSITA